MQTAQAFFAREIRRISRAIDRMCTEIEDYPAANGNHDGMYAMVEIQYQHKSIVHGLAAQAPDDLDGALHICRARLIVVQEAREAIVLSGGAHDLREADHWWQMLNEMHYLISLTARLQREIQLRESHASADGHTDADTAEAWSWIH